MMKRACVLIAMSLASASIVLLPTDFDVVAARAQRVQPTLRIALVGLSRANSVTHLPGIETALADALARDTRINLIDQSMVQPALTGIGYDGSINLSKDEARRLAAAIGCDFFIVGKAEVFARSEREGESHQLAYVALMTVDGRTGALADFEFFSEKAGTESAASSAAVKNFERRVADFVDRAIQFHARSLSEPAQRSSSSQDVTEEIPDEDSPRVAGFKPPEFLNRVKPEYTNEAELADITATVEAMAVLRSNGEVGTVEITRWAGFGLDESAERAIRQLKFKPATRDGKPINVRALVRYNFRRVSESSSKSEDLRAKLRNEPERDRRRLFSPAKGPLSEYRSTR
jgi:TonB family protein